MSLDDGLEAITGDRASAEVLRRSLREMAQRYAGSPLGSKVREVLAGRRDLGELADDPEFAAFTASGMREYHQAWDALTPQEREQQLAAGEAYLTSLGEEIENGRSPRR